MRKTIPVQFKNDKATSFIFWRSAPTLFGLLFFFYWHEQCCYSFYGKCFSFQELDILSNEDIINSGLKTPVTISLKGEFFRYDAMLFFKTTQNI